MTTHQITTDELRLLLSGDPEARKRAEGMLVDARDDRLAGDLRAAWWGEDGCSEWIDAGKNHRIRWLRAAAAARAHIAGEGRRVTKAEVCTFLTKLWDTEGESHEAAYVAFRAIGFEVEQ